MVIHEKLILTLRQQEAYENIANPLPSVHLIGVFAYTGDFLTDTPECQIKEMEKCAE